MQRLLFELDVEVPVRHSAALFHRGLLQLFQRPLRLQAGGSILQHLAGEVGIGIRRQLSAIDPAFQ